MEEGELEELSMHNFVILRKVVDSFGSVKEVSDIEKGYLKQVFLKKTTT